MQVLQPANGGNTTSDGTAVVIDECLTTPSFRSWTVVNGGSNTGTGPVGPIEILDWFCLDVTNGIDKSSFFKLINFYFKNININVDGTKLQVWKCTEGDKNQQWTVNSDLTIRWAGTNKCVDLTNGIETGGNPVSHFVRFNSLSKPTLKIQIWTCTENNYHLQWIPFPINPAVDD